jgi:hypothetical protein
MQLSALHFVHFEKFGKPDPNALRCPQGRKLGFFHVLAGPFVFPLPFCAIGRFKSEADVALVSWSKVANIVWKSQIFAANRHPNKSIVLFVCESFSTKCKSFRLTYLSINCSLLSQPLFRETKIMELHSCGGHALDGRSVLPYLAISYVYFYILRAAIFSSDTAAVGHSEATCVCPQRMLIQRLTA